MTTQNLAITQSLHRANGASGTQATVSSRVSATVNSPTSETMSSGVAASTQDSGFSSFAPMVTEALIRFNVPAPAGLPPMVTAHVGGWIVSSANAGTVADQIGKLVRMPDVVSFTSEWFTPTELATGDLLFTTGAPGVSPAPATFHRFDITFSMDPTKTAVLVLAPQACFSGLGYTQGHWTFHEPSSSGTSTTSGAFEYAYVDYSTAWPWHVVDAGSAGGTIWRLGPDSNPDGGIARLVMPDGTIYVQNPTGAPMALADITGSIPALGKLPMVLDNPTVIASYTQGPDITGSDHPSTYSNSTAYRGSGNGFWWSHYGVPGLSGQYAEPPGGRHFLDWPVYSDPSTPGTPGSTGTLYSIDLFIRGYTEFQDTGYAAGSGSPGPFTAPLVIGGAAHTFSGSIASALTSNYFTWILSPGDRATVQAAFIAGDITGSLAFSPVGTNLIVIDSVALRLNYV